MQISEARVVEMGVEVSRQGYILLGVSLENRVELSSKHVQTLISKLSTLCYLSQVKGTTIEAI